MTHTCTLSQDPVSRIMALSETCIVERDPATYQVVTIKPLCEVFALVRYSDDPQRFTIEYSSGRVKRYSATDRYILSDIILYWCMHRDAAEKGRNKLC